MKTKRTFVNVALLATVMAFAARSRAADGYWDARFSWPSGQGVNGIVNAVAVDGTDVYVGGSFTKAGSVNATNIAKWNGNSWSALGAGVNDQVYAIAVRGPDVYAGGKFTAAGGINAYFVAKWNGTSWSALGSGPNNGVGGYVYALGPDLAYDGVYVGGVFGVAGGVSANSIARWSSAGWFSLTGSSGQNGVNGVVYAITASGSEVYVGGDFTMAGGVTANHIARWDLVGEEIGVWSALTDMFNKNGVNGNVYAIAVSPVNASDIYVGGSFTGPRSSYIVRFDGTMPLWDSVGGGVNGSVMATAPSGTNLYVGGNFTQAGEASANRIARWDGYNWAALSNGLNGTVDALATGNAHVYIGGGFTTAGGRSSSDFAIWHETPPLPPQIMDFRVSGGDCLIGFTTQHGREYVVERCSTLTSNSWAAFTNVISGTSGIITVADPGAATNATTRFYRVRAP